jgi:hypothetical protein
VRGVRPRGLVSCSATSTVFGLNKDRAQPNDPLLAIDGVPLRGYCQLPLGRVCRETRPDCSTFGPPHVARPLVCAEESGDESAYAPHFHEVDDVDRWLSSPKRRQFLGPLGFTVRTFVNPAKTNRVGLIVEGGDLATPKGDTVRRRSRRNAL